MPQLDNRPTPNYPEAFGYLKGSFQIAIIRLRHGASAKDIEKFLTESLEASIQIQEGFTNG